MKNREVKREDQKSLEKKLFEERLARLKKAFKCHSDGELAKRLQLKQQAVYAAKRRTKIPNTWLDFAAKENISSEYIMDGKGPINFTGIEIAQINDLYSDPEIIIKRNDRRRNARRAQLRHSMLNQPPKAIENIVAAALFKLSLESVGVSLDNRSRSLFITYFQKHLLPKIVSDMAEEIRDFAEMVQNQDDQSGQTDDQET